MVDGCLSACVDDCREPFSNRYCLQDNGAGPDISCSSVYLPPTKEEVNAISRDVCLSVCLSVSKISLHYSKNACMDLDEMLRVDRCRDMDELINFLDLSGL